MLHAGGKTVKKNALIGERGDLLLFIFLVRIVLLELLPVLARGAGHGCAGSVLLVASERSKSVTEKTESSGCR